MNFTSYITPRDGIPRRVDWKDLDNLPEAQRQTRLLGLELFGASFTYSVRPA